MERKSLVLGGATVALILVIYLTATFMSSISDKPSCVELKNGKFRHYSIACILEESEPIISVGCKWDISNDTNTNCSLTELYTLLNVTTPPLYDCVSYNNISIERGLYLASDCLLDGFSREHRDKIGITLTPYLNNSPTQHVYSELQKKQDAVEDGYGST